MANIITPNSIRVIPMEIARYIFNWVAIRGRYRLGSILSRICMPKGKIALRHRLGDVMVFDFSNEHEVSMYYDLFAPALSRIIKTKLGPGDCFIDCGANIGYFSFLASSLVGAAGKVISIDANPYCIERIQESRSIGNYRNMDIVPCAIGDQDGEIEFNLADDPMYSSLADLEELEFASIESTIIVPMRTLDDVLREHQTKSKQRVRLLKLDVEGAEIDVLRGAEESINAKSLDYIYVEVHGKQMGLRGQDPEELFELLAARGFAIEEEFGPNAFLYKSTV